MIDATFAVIEDEALRNELAEFYAEHKSRFYMIANSKLHNREEAEDAVQEVFSAIANKPEMFFGVPEENRLAYTDVMVRNISVGMFNAKNKMFLVELDDETGNGGVSLENSLFDRISRDEISAFIDALPPLQRNVLMLHCLFGLSIEETAQRLNISLTAANKRLTRARKAVREFIDERSKRNE
ncbi:MAG: RNA polymerase sigma factor [Lachnospiraceae bacterium]|nr:RNA polymerase sigma factor [Ruminococcus sp.]MCM1275582.1 RNA polymerase sigma factor [Lachnospiraceae bacterium]